MPLASGEQDEIVPDRDADVNEYRYFRILDELYFVPARDLANSKKKKSMFNLGFIGGETDESENSTDVSYERLEFELKKVRAVVRAAMKSSKKNQKEFGVVKAAVIDGFVEAIDNPTGGRSIFEMLFQTNRLDKAMYERVYEYFMNEVYVKHKLHRKLDAKKFKSQKDVVREITKEEYETAVEAGGLLFKDTTRDEPHWRGY